MENRIKRITEMEARLNRLATWLDNMTGDVGEDARALDEYYRSPLWRQDFEADEAGELPPDLPRGVLSEDGLYNALTEYEGRKMTYEEAVKSIPCGKYRHFKGNEYQVIGIARHSETAEPMVVYRALYGQRELWVRPACMWNETVQRDGKVFRRFERIE